MLGTPYLTYALFKVGKIMIFLNYYNFTYTYVVFEIVGNYFFYLKVGYEKEPWALFPVA